MERNVTTPAIVVMGVSGSGKTTVGQLLADRLRVPFVDADDLHPPANRAKMAGGTPLTDDDRAPWLEAVGRAMSAADGGVVVACSALRRRYRDTIAAAAERPVRFAHLAGPEALLHERMAAREHFMPPALLRSQLDTLEPLDPAEPGRSFATAEEPAYIASRIHDWITTEKDAAA
ncbi:gluconokinase [Leifsonia sp. NPDC058194]|uniref:gluconokinase n=1 Tax=Leifsonia sp. NPDC058194 TaxID=3346374 RepID=UPI0036DC31DF